MVWSRRQLAATAGTGHGLGANGPTTTCATRGACWHGPCPWGLGCEAWGVARPRTWKNCFQPVRTSELNFFREDPYHNFFSVTFLKSGLVGGAAGGNVRHWSWPGNQWSHDHVRHTWRVRHGTDHVPGVWDVGRGAWPDPGHEKNFPSPLTNLT